MEQEHNFIADYYKGLITKEELIRLAPKQWERELEEIKNDHIMFNCHPFFNSDLRDE